MMQKNLILLFVLITPMTIQLLAKKKERASRQEKKVQQDAQSTSHKRIAELHIMVKGMVCPFCSSRLDLVLKKLPFVEDVKNIDIAKGTMQLFIKKNTKYTLDEMTSDLKKTITEATFTFDSVEKAIEE